ncbi:hypothetical protein GCM10023317_28260 [Actinopolymorpha pittospori]
MASNLRWTRSGTGWADWILTGVPYGLRPIKDKHACVRCTRRCSVPCLASPSCWGSRSRVPRWLLP